MESEKYKYIDFSWRHKLISFVRDINVRGFRKLSLILPKYILPNPKKFGAHIMQTIHGFKLIIDPSIDNGVELSLYETGTYEKGILNYIKQNFKPDGCFVDVGANIGLMSIFTAHNFPKSNVLSFEAHPKTVEILKENIALNNIKNCHIYSHALGNEPGNLTIYDNWEVSRGGASLVVISKDSVGYPVEVKRLDDVIGTHSPTMMKVDVEGFEMEVLKGASDTIKRHLPVLIVEASEERTNRHASSRELVSFIQELGPYRIYRLAGSKERKSALIEVLTDGDLPSHDNLICVAKND